VLNVASPSPERGYFVGAGSLYPASFKTRHVMDKGRTLKRITDWEPVVGRIGRPRLRRDGDVRVDVGKTKFHIWSKMAMD
jgi:hypothetical protein